MMYYWIIYYLRTFSTEQNRQNDGSVSANFVGKFTRLMTSLVSDLGKRQLRFFCQIWGDRNIILRAGPELKFENYESVQT